MTSPFLGRVLAAFAFAAAFPMPANAQLLSEQVRDNQRVCTYVGTRELPNGQTVSLEQTVMLNQSCPVTAPYRDPNSPVPPNAMLTGERTTADERSCQYSEGGVDYEVTVAIALRCSATPALLAKAAAANTRQTP